LLIHAVSSSTVTTKTLEFLLQQPNININLSCSKELATAPLHEAIKNKHAEKIALLLKQNNIDLTTKDSSGKTPMQVAVDMQDWGNSFPYRMHQTKFIW
jgi:ankyrin repeat protein